MTSRLSSILFLVFLLPGFFVQAQVELPADELAKESVVPKFDNSVTIKSRNITLASKFEVGLYYGWNFAEPIENQSKVGLNLGYHWDEVNSFFLNYASWLSGLNTQYTSSLHSSPYSLDFTRAPALQSSAWLNYEANIYYGKISITKKGISNLSVYPILGVGMTNYTNKSYYGLNAGVGAKFYFSSRWALRTDFKIQYSGQPSPFLGGYMRTDQTAPQAGQFTDVYAVGTILDIGLIALF